MSADKHRSLAIRVAYLRLASRDGGLALNIKWARKLTRFLKRMVDEGEITLRREGCGGRKSATVAYATSKGLARLEEAVRRFGPDFGPTSATGRIEPVCERKEHRRDKIISPEDRRARAKVDAARRARSLEIILGRQAHRAS